MVHQYQGNKRLKTTYKGNDEVRILLFLTSKTVTRRIIFNQAEDKDTHNNNCAGCSREHTASLYQ